MILCCVAGILNAQEFSYTVSTRPEICQLGTASLTMAGTENGDHVKIEWSTGQQDFTSLRGLGSGTYWVKIEVSGRRDTVDFVSDTLLNFTVEKEQCPVGVPLHFSPNGDGYNDELRLSNIEKYPNFELLIFNKWGQQVHRQRERYMPWRGDWNGVDLPDGAYYYVLIYDKNEPRNLQKGDITILR